MHYLSFLIFVVLSFNQPNVEARISDGILGDVVLECSRRAYCRGSCGDTPWTLYTRASKNTPFLVTNIDGKLVQEATVTKVESDHNRFDWDEPISPNARKRIYIDTEVGTLTTISHGDRSFESSLKNTERAFWRGDEFNCYAFNFATDTYKDFVKHLQSGKLAGKYLYPNL